MSLLNYVPFMLLWLTPSRSLRAFVSRALRTQVIHVSRALHALMLHVPHTVHALLLTTIICNLFISHISLQDKFIYVNLTTLIHWPAFIRKPALLVHEIRDQNWENILKLRDKFWLWFPKSSTFKPSKNIGLPCQIGSFRS